MLQNEYLVAKIGVDTAENEPRKERCVAASRRGGGARGDRRGTSRRARRGAAPQVPVCLPPPTVGAWSKPFKLLRFRLHRRRFLQLNTHFAAFCEIYKMSKLKFQNFSKKKSKK